MKLGSCRPSHLFGQSIEYSNLLYIEIYIISQGMWSYHLNQWSAGWALKLFSG